MGSARLGSTRKVGSTVKLENTEKEKLRREDHLRVKHDKLFSNWKILVGPSDWKDHAAGQEGSQRYRLRNLPAAYMGPGVYELGLTRHSHLAVQESKQRKLSRDAVVVVYLGQADNVRQRLQRYGQTGSHLEGSRLTAVSTTDELEEPARQGVSKPAGVNPDHGSKETGIDGGLRLFTEVFSRGYSIAFRWARTESKPLAEKVEAELLKVFDYPWNTCLNGARRPRDILAKLEMLQYHLERSLCLGRALGIGSRKWEYLSKKVGVSVAVRKPLEEDKSTSVGPKFAIFLRSTRASQETHVPEKCSSVCGVILEDGSSCSIAPVQGCKRCSVHKGLRIRLSSRRVQPRPTKLGADDRSDPAPRILTLRTQLKGKRVEITEVASLGVVCGVLVDGSPCLKQPAKGRKRCSDHKGTRLTRSGPKSLDSREVGK